MESARWERKGLARTPPARRPRDRHMGSRARARAMKLWRQERSQDALRPETFLRFSQLVENLPRRGSQASVEVVATSHDVLKGLRQLRRYQRLPPVNEHLTRQVGQRVNALVGEPAPEDLRENAAR